MIGFSSNTLSWLTSIVNPSSELENSCQLFKLESANDPSQCLLAKFPAGTTNAIPSSTACSIFLVIWLFPSVGKFGHPADITIMSTCCEIASSTAAANSMSVSIEYKYSSTPGATSWMISATAVPCNASFSFPWIGTYPIPCLNDCTSTILSVIFLLSVNARSSTATLVPWPVIPENWAKSALMKYTPSDSASSDGVSSNWTAANGDLMLSIPPSVLSFDKSLSFIVNWTCLSSLAFILPIELNCSITAGSLPANSITIWVLPSS